MSSEQHSSSRHGSESVAPLPAMAASDRSNQRQHEEEGQMASASRMSTAPIHFEDVDLSHHTLTSVDGIQQLPVNEAADSHLARGEMVSIPLAEQAAGSAPLALESRLAHVDDSSTSWHPSSSRQGESKQLQAGESNGRYGVEDLGPDLKWSHGQDSHHTLSDQSTDMDIHPYTISRIDPPPPPPYTSSHRLQAIHHYSAPAASVSRASLPLPQQPSAPMTSGDVVVSSPTASSVAGQALQGHTDVSNTGYGALAASAHRSSLSQQQGSDVPASNGAANTHISHVDSVTQQYADGEGADTVAVDVGGIHGLPGQRNQLSHNSAPRMGQQGTSVTGRVSLSGEDRAHVGDQVQGRAPHLGQLPGSRNSDAVDRGGSQEDGPAPAVALEPEPHDGDGLAPPSAVPLSHNDVGTAAMHGTSGIRLLSSPSTSPEGLLGHGRDAEDEAESHTCPHCNKIYSSKRSLKAHLKLHSTGSKRYVCQQCHQQFTRKDHLVRHERLHTDERPYACSFCHKRFNTAWKRTKHEAIHKGEKRYVCDECGKAFADDRSRAVHRRVHTGEKPYKCDHCDRTFSQKSNMMRHRLIHLEQKPYQCDVCHRCFREKSTLAKHRRTHTGEKPFMCRFCDKTFSRRDNCTAHEKTHRQSLQTQAQASGIAALSNRDESDIPLPTPVSGAHPVQHGMMMHVLSHPAVEPAGQHDHGLHQNLHHIHQMHNVGPDDNGLRRHNRHSHVAATSAGADQGHPHDNVVSQHVVHAPLPPMDYSSQPQAPPYSAQPNDFHLQSHQSHQHYQHQHQQHQQHLHPQQYQQHYTHQYVPQHLHPQTGVARTSSGYVAHAAPLPGLAYIPASTPVSAEAHAPVAPLAYRPVSSEASGPTGHVRRHDANPH